MGTIELLSFLVLGIIYLTIPVITLVIVVRNNNRLKRIEDEIELLRSSA